MRGKMSCGVEVFFYMAYPQPPAPHHHYLQDLKQCVIYQQFTLDKSTTEIEKALNMSLQVVHHVLKMYEEIGDTVKDPKACTRPGFMPLLDAPSVEVNAPCSVGISD